MKLPGACNHVLKLSIRVQIFAEASHSVHIPIGIGALIKQFFLFHWNGFFCFGCFLDALEFAFFKCISGDLERFFFNCTRLANIERSSNCLLLFNI